MQDMHSLPEKRLGYIIRIANHWHKGIRDDEKFVILDYWESQHQQSYPALKRESGRRCWLCVSLEGLTIDMQSCNCVSGIFMYGLLFYLRLQYV